MIHLKRFGVGMVVGSLFCLVVLGVVTVLEFNPLLIMIPVVGLLIYVMGAFALEVKDLK
jgi:hypothetical protein